MERPRVSVKKLTVILSAAFIVLTLLTGVFALLFLGNPYDEETMASKAESVSETSDEAQEQAPEEADRSEGSSELEEESDISSSEEMKSSSEEEEKGEASEKEDEPSESVPDDSVSEEGGQEAPVGEVSKGESSGGAQSAPEYTPSFNIPSELRGVQVSAGIEYLADPANATPAAVAAQIDQAVAGAKDLTMNTIIIGAQQLSDGFDSVDYLVSKAREEGLYVFAVYDVKQLPGGGSASAADGETLDKVAEAAGGFAETYKPDAILLDGYANPAEASGYSGYLQNGGGMGYENYMRRVPEALLQTCAEAIRAKAPDTQVGLMSAAVWENASANPEGSETAAAYTDLSGGNTDTRALLRKGLFDCVMVKNYGSTNEQAANFDTVAAWWAAEAKNDGITLYMMHAADRVGTQSVGWTVYEQLTKQIIDLEKIPGISGSAFNSQKALAANPGNSTTTLIQYMNDQINEQYVLTQLSVSKPDKLTFTTKEQSVTFQGASDPQEKVTLNGQEIPTNESGYFTVQERLEPGANKFVIAHKNKSFTYTITREVDVLKEIQPVGSMTVEGGMEVRVTALAYEGASVSASIGGQSITLSPTEDLEDEELRKSGYIMYAGSFTAPAASGSAVAMGTLTVTASAQGTTKTLQGASVTVNKLATVGEGGIIQVVSDQAETFPIGTLDDTSSPACYPLPKGTIDMTSGDEIVYSAVANKETKNYRYWKLQSGLRVYSSDIQSVSANLPDNNTISKMGIKSSGQYTTVTLATQYKVPYSVSYDGSNVAFAFKYTSNVPDSVTLKDNAIFAAADWGGSTLTLRLRKSGGFIGYKAYYEGDNLVLRFNNAPGSLSGARIVVDPGHGGNDPGASGFYPGKDEADINLAIAQKLAAELQNRGASVLMTTPGSTMASRMAAARAFNPQVLVSIHGNSSEANASASGTEVYYFYPFSKQLAANIAANASSSLGSTNRGAKSGLYYMTRESQFAAVLVETGFVTNEAEYSKLINSKYQTRIAQGIANGISGYLGGANSGGGTGGTDDEDEEENEDEPEESGGESGNEEALTLNKSSLTLEVDEKATLSASVDNVEWQSDDSDVAKVSSSGKVTAVGEGSTYIWAYSGDNEAKCKVTVTSDGNGGGVRDIEIEGDSRLWLGDRGTYSASAIPAGSSDVDWWIEDNTILAISSTSGDSCRVEAIGTGETYLCAAAKEDSSVEKRFRIVVEE